MAQTMKDILNRMLNHEELSREEMKNILIGITQAALRLTNCWVSAMVFWKPAFPLSSMLTVILTW